MSPDRSVTYVSGPYLPLTLSRRERAMERRDAEGCCDGGQQSSQRIAAQRRQDELRRSFALSRRKRVRVRGCGSHHRRSIKNSPSLRGCEEIGLTDVAGSPSPHPSPGGRGRSSGVTCTCISHSTKKMHGQVTLRSCPMSD